jgi:16S rRNA (cytidine1402-2'-O)-methyltransferase
LTEPARGTLYVCGTPIGNLKDTTFRLLEVLKEVDAVFCEDTRRTLKLLAHFDIRKPLISLHQHVERERTVRVLDFLRQGKSVAIVSDAGMPAISDPGAYVVNAARDDGHRILVVPGPSSVSGALAVSGFPADRFVFAGFPPRKPKERRRFFLEWVRPGVTAVFFESPFRVKKALADLSTVFPDCNVRLCHEMTKIHESVIAGTVSEVLIDLKEETLQGEWVVVVRLDPGSDQEDATGETQP